MLFFILIDVQYSQKVAFSFGKGPNRQNHSSSGSLYRVKKLPPVKFPILPTSLGGIYLCLTPYHYLENPASIVQIFCQLQKAVLLRIFQASPPK